MRRKSNQMKATAAYESLQLCRQHFPWRILQPTTEQANRRSVHRVVNEYLERRKTA